MSGTEDEYTGPDKEEGPSWEKVCSNSCLTDFTDRLRVDGGWIYRSTQIWEGSDADGDDEVKACTESSVFIAEIAVESDEVILRRLYEQNGYAGVRGPIDEWLEADEKASHAEYVAKNKRRAESKVTAVQD